MVQRAKYHGKRFVEISQPSFNPSLYDPQPKRKFKRAVKPIKDKRVEPPLQVYLPDDTDDIS
jgi:hypothetical protein